MAAQDHQPMPDCPYCPFDKVPNLSTLKRREGGPPMDAVPKTNNVDLRRCQTWSPGKAGKSPIMMGEWQFQILLYEAISSELVARSRDVFSEQCKPLIRMLSMKIPLLLIAGFIGLSANAAPKIGPEDSARILRSATRLVDAKPGRFAVFTETASKKYVQFTGHDKAITFDFPVILASVPNAPKLLRDANCSFNPPTKNAAELERRILRKEEELRLTRLLSAQGFQWHLRYCLSLTEDDRRAGYNMSVFGTLDNSKRVPAFVEDVFREVYLMPSIEGIEIETDE